MPGAKKQKLTAEAKFDLLSPVCLSLMDENAALNDRIAELQRKIDSKDEELMCMSTNWTSTSRRLDESLSKINFMEGERLELDWRLETYEHVIDELLNRGVGLVRGAVSAMVMNTARDPQMWSGIDVHVAEMLTDADLFESDEMDGMFSIEDIEWGV